MKIKDEHIKEAENLLIDGNEFDLEERVPFIKDLNTCDLLAVPGSGKTTALLAKLYCLSKNLPFKDGSGILILSHTNAAVEEIEKNLKSYCPSLFEYPNFVGTVQSFVNTFLANQACQVKYGSYIRQNDDELYNFEVNDFFYSLKWSKRGQEPKNLINKLFGLVNAGRRVEFQEGKEKILDFLKRFYFDISERKLIYYNRTILKHDSPNQPYYIELENWKENLFRKGLLNYRDSFNLADWYLNNYSEVKLLLQNRFRYVFIDETQDLESFQIELIEKIFNTDNSNTKIQRIGDINQSIYNSGKSVKTNADWEPRNQRFLNGSKRLTKEVSELVNCFTLDRQKDDNGDARFVVNGLRELQKPIKPHLVLFNKESIGKLEETFKELIKENKLEETIESEKYGFKIIGWSAKWDDNGSNNDKLRLENIFSNYNKESKSKKETFDTLSKYLQYFNKDKSSLEPARKTILNALIAVLKLENKTYKIKIRGQEIERYYTKSELIKDIKNQPDNDVYENFKSLLYQWSFEIMVANKASQTYNSIKNFIQNEFKEWFNLEINDGVKTFLDEEYNELVNIVNLTEDVPLNKEEIPVEIGTVHSVKGQTHCATMYVETSYINYESEKLNIIAKKATKTKPEIILPNPLLYEEHEYRTNKDSRAKETLKMMYVGFSRPTHLLCFAMLKENLVEHVEKYKNSGWEIIDLTD
ncbi:Superfamily I DNA or RNA helicase [Zhouia amylolytica]|uniref:DNA 3'-5' helicase II n=1 Tax=Zhouia amylolytica TaxID=376730 RepID=A0A1I6T634_9FLAO|nr:UvrD-helicase domain-containing protein [Zhouia amylolytica]SFS84623.1 Superfamily I DNA or RNA helicase [Zhouia amylolytica]